MQAIPLELVLNAQQTLALVSSSPDVPPLLRMRAAEVVGMLRAHTKAALAGLSLPVDRKGVQP